MSSPELAERSDADFLGEVVMTAWKNEISAYEAMQEDQPLVIAVDADCPRCGWPERTYDTASRRFGCTRCEYTSDERNA